MKLLDKIANFALILGVTVFLILVIRGEFNRHKQPTNSPVPPLGKSISLPGLQFSHKHKSLVVVISTTCHFCQDSMPFYRDLASKAQGRLDLVAVFPQPLPEGRAFLQKADVPVTEVVSANLTTIGIVGTPTLLLVNGDGKVEELWQGLLDEKGRQQVLSRTLQ